MNANLAYLTREPAVNRRYQITANRLCLHATTTDQALATLDAAKEYWPQTHPVFLSTMRLAPTARLLSWSWPESTFLEIPLQALALPTTEMLLAQCDRQRLPLCLSWYDGTSPYPESAQWRFALVDWRKTHHPGKAPGVALAWGTTTVADHEAALKEFAGLCGWSFLTLANAAPAKAHDPAPARTTVLQLIALLQQDAPIEAIEQPLKRDVALGYRLLRYLNSAALGLRVEITSFRHAVSLLGYQPLLRWLAVLLIHSHDHPAMPALAQTALTRARYLELLSTSFLPADEAESLFLCGLFSILPQLTGLPFDTALEGLTLPEAVRDALVLREGPYAPLLSLAQASESASPAALVAVAEELGVPATRHNAYLLQALEFADEINQ